MPDRHVKVQPEIEYFSLNNDYRFSLCLCFVCVLTLNNLITGFSERIGKITGQDFGQFNVLFSGNMPQNHAEPVALVTDILPVLRSDIFKLSQKNRSLLFSVNFSQGIVFHLDSRYSCGASTQDKTHQ